MDLLISCLHVVENMEKLNKIRAYILSDNRITIMCYAVVETPLLLKNNSTLNSSNGNLLCLLSVSHGYKAISEMKRRKMISRDSTIITSDIDESEKIYRNNEVIIGKARYIYQYSDFVRYFDIK